jgi:long-chain fatty acid transport protein
LHNVVSQQGGGVVTDRQRIRYPLFGVALAIALLFVASPAYPSGFQLMTQGARAMGMGLAFTAVADDPTAVFYNPAGLSWQDKPGVTIGGSLASRVSADFQGTNPYPGPVTEHVQNQNFFLPNVYANIPVIANTLNVGFGVYSPYGLGFRWKNAEVFTGGAGTSPVSTTESFSGRFIGQNTYIQTLDLNPVVSFRVVPQLALAVGLDFRFSKVMLERNEAAIDPFTNSIVDVAHVKLNSDLTDNHGWGFNAGLMFKPIDMLSVGVGYHSRITVDYSGTATFKQRPSGDAQFDAIVASQLPGSQKITTTIKFPSTLNLGIAVRPIPCVTISGQADWTEWSTFKSLDIAFVDPSLDIHRATLWKDAWAYRGGVEWKFTRYAAVRAGYYYDKTPQPLVDVGPLLADNTRDAFTFGFGYNTETWGVDIGDVYLKFHKRDATGANTDDFHGTYKESANVGSINFRFSF